MEIAGEADNFFDTNNSHIVVMSLNIVFEAHWSIFVSNSSKLSVCFNGKELGRGLKMLRWSEERVDFGLNSLELLGIGQTCEKES